jgi:uncharacterized membrane protein (GlpM family)
MQIALKALLSLVIIFAATAAAKRLPAAGGLIATMPLAGALVLVWVYIESGGDRGVMQVFSKGALWGILPSIIFYLVAFACFKWQRSLTVTLLASFAAWGVAALVHQLVVR